MRESVINFPNLAVKISRPYSIKVRYQKENGETVTTTLTDLSSRLFQMAVRTLDGIIFFNDANYLNKQKAVKDWKNIQRKLVKA